MADSSLVAQAKMSGDNDVKSDANDKKEETTNKRKKVPTLKGNTVVAVLLVVYILFNLLAAYIFILFERENDLKTSALSAKTPSWFKQAKRDFLATKAQCVTPEDLDDFLEDVERAVLDGYRIVDRNETDQVVKSRWSLESAFLFTFTISSTIGYGRVTPVTTGGQLFCIFFAFLSIPFTGLLAAKLGWVMAYYIKKLVGSTCGSFTRTKPLSVLFALIVGIIIYIILPTLLLLYVSNEEEWTFVQCLYCVIVTLTTIGFGDYVPDPGAQGGMLTTMMVLIWVVAGLAWLASIVNIIATTMTRKAQSIGKKVKAPPPPVLKQNLENLGMEKSSDRSQVQRKLSIDEENNRSDQVDITSREHEDKQPVNAHTDMSTQTETCTCGPGPLHTVISNNMEES